MNVENATSDDSMKIDEDLVAALGFEPASDILIVDDALNDDLSISSDDIRVSTKEPTTDAVSSTAKADSRPPSRKSNKGKNKGKNKVPAPVNPTKKSNLVDRLNADSKTADSKAADSKAAGSKTTGSKTTDAKKTAKPDAKSAPAKSASAKADEALKTSKQDSASKSGAAKKVDSTSGQKSEAKAKDDNPGFSIAPPPPIAANAVLLSEPSPATYGFSDVKLPDIKGAFAKLGRSNGTRSDAEAAVAKEGVAEERVIANSDALTAEVATVVTADPATTAAPDAKPAKSPQRAAETVIDARVAESPPKVAETPPIIGGPATSPPTIDPDPDIRIIEAPAEPNVYRAPTKSGRTRIRSRKVRRQIRHIDPWSVLTFSVIFHACVFGALLLASVLVWRFADGAGLIDKTESFWAELADKPDFEIDQGVLVRAAAMIAGLMAIASSVLMVLLTVFFNLISDIVGGIRVTVIEEEPVRVTK